MKLPFAMKNGRMVTPDEVDAGLNCGCTCPNCGEPVMAKKGSIRVHHFAHLPSEKSEACDPNYARETAIHLMAKQIIADRRYFESPRFARSVAQKDILLRSHYETAVIAEKETLQFARIDVEFSFEGYKPDLIGHTPDGRKIIIEIRVTHRCSKEKIQWMRKSGLLALEVDLSNTELSPLPSKQEVEEAIKKAEAHWLSHPNYDTAMTQARDRLKKKVAQVNHEIRENAAKKRKEKQAKAVDRPAKETADGRINPDAPPTIPRDCGHYDPRWFLCRPCYHVFSIPLSEAPCHLQYVTCPKCGGKVVASPPPISW